MQELEMNRDDARDAMDKARGQFKYLSNLVMAQAAAAKRKRAAAASTADARRDAAASAAEARRDGGGGCGGEGVGEVGGDAPAAALGGVAGGGRAAVDEGAASKEDGVGGVGGGAEEALLCPVCLSKDVGSSEVVMLPCGHMLCYVCCRDLMKR